MNVASLVLALIASLFSFLQGGCITVLGGAGSRMAEGTGEAGNMAAVAGGGIFVVIASIIGIVGGVFSATKKRIGWICLAVSAGICVLASLTGYNDAFIWAIIYSVAAFLGRASYAKQ